MKTVERYGPPIGSPEYEELCANFIPMNSPASEMTLDRFLVPTGALPPVSTEITWVKSYNPNPEEQTVEELREWMGHYIDRFFQIATVQGVADDVVQVEIFRILDGEELAAQGRYIIVEPVTRQGIPFENAFERHIFNHKVRHSFGPVLERPDYMLGGMPVSEDKYPTLEARIAKHRIDKVELIAIAKLQTVSS